MSSIDVAASANGGTASASSTNGAGYSPSYAINGDRTGAVWGTNGGWNDGTANTFDDWLEVDFSGSFTIDEIDVIGLQDNYTSPITPTLSLTSTLYGLKDFDVQYWNGSSWVTITGGSVTANNKVWRQFTFASVTTTKIRVLVHNTQDALYSRIVELEAWTQATPTAPSTPSPADTATSVSAVPTLSFGGAAGATTYDYYLGLTSTPPLVLAGSASSTFSPGTLTSLTTYYWKVVANNSSGSTSGPVWSFTTMFVQQGVSVTIEAKLNGVWTDITADRAHTNGTPMRMNGGGQGTGPGDVVATDGSFTFELNNSIHCSGGVAGYYSPNNANRRAYWGLNVPIRIGIAISANPKYYKFAGWVDQIVPVAGLYNAQTVKVIAVDWLAQASSTICAGVAAQVGQRGDQLLATLVSLVPTAPFATSYDTGPDTFTYALDDLDPSSSAVLQGITNVAVSGLDRVYIKGDTVTGGVLKFESHSFRRTFATDAFVLADMPPAGQPSLALTALNTAQQRANVINELRFTIHPRTVDTGNKVLYSLTVDPTTAVSIPPAGGSVTIWANYTDPAQPAQQIAGTSMVAPMATTDYTMNTAVNGSGTNLTASFTVTVSFFASTAKIVITNNHASLSGFVTFLQLRGLGIYSYTALTADSADSVSQAAFGQTLSAIDMPYQSVIGQAQAAADYLLTLYTTAAYTSIGSVQVFCTPSDELSLWTLIQAEVSTAFSVSEAMSGFSGYPLWVNGWQVEIDERNNFTFTFYPEPRDAHQYWSLGVAGLSELGITTYLGPF